MIEAIIPNEENRKITDSEIAVLVGFLKRDPLYGEQLALMDRMQDKYGGRVRFLVYQDGFLDAGMRQHMVTGTPTYLLFHKGGEVDRLMGRSDQETMDAFLQRCLGPR